ncbi:MAG TPA: SH3 domain-containing protein, partial [Thermomicrobiales bacterium]|nr:SH3 domain-containing protein [Thermomicrobiales bacterium]
MTRHCSPRDLSADRLFDRRVILKACGSFGAMAALGGTTGRIARAQDGQVETLAGKWIEEESVGAFTIASDRLGFRADFPFFAIAPHWGGDGDPSALVEMQFSSDGESWTDPVAVGVASDDAGQSDRDGRIFGRLVMLESGASRVQYRALDADGAPTDLPSLAFTYIDATGGPSIDDIFRAAAVEPTVERPPIISRADWGANERYQHEDQKRSKPIVWPPEYQTVEHVVIHHSATPNFQDPLTTVRSIYYYHAVERGWGDIGYNYLVDWQGNVYEGRVGGDNVVGGHAYQYAHGSSGICTIGNFMDDEPTDEALAALIWITAWVGRDLDPWGSADFHEQSDFPTIASHRDCFPKDLCPGDMLYADLDYIRGAVAEVLSYQSDTEPNSTFGDGDEVRIIYDGTNLRSGPGLDFTILRELPWDSRFLVNDGPVNSDDYNWYKVTGDLGLGWCVEPNLEPLPDSVPARFSVGDSVVASNGVRLRAFAGLSGSVIGRLANGDEGTVLDGPDYADGYFWYRIETNVGTGWSASDFLEANGGPSTGDFQIGDAVTVATDLLRLRTSPSTSAGTNATMPFGTQLQINGSPERADGYTWYPVNTSSYGSGWCAGEYLTAGGLGPGNDARVIDGELNL